MRTNAMPAYAAVMIIQARAPEHAQMAMRAGVAYAHQMQRASTMPAQHDVRARARGAWWPPTRRWCGRARRMAGPQAGGAMPVRMRECGGKIRWPGMGEMAIKPQIDR